MGRVPDRFSEYLIASPKRSSAMCLLVFYMDNIYSTFTIAGLGVRNKIGRAPWQAKI